MSGITPLLDTLLHQVLGKRAEVPPPRDLNPPVRPTAPAEAPRAVHSDSRLEARTPAVPSQATPTGGRPGSVPSAPPASAQTHFSASARTIAEVLQRFPAPPSALSPAAPPIPGGQAATPAALARRLEGSVRDSGLFYEAHLARWYKGELTRQQLEREPQMWRTQRFLPLPATGASPSPALSPAPTMSHGVAGAPAGEAEAMSRGLPDTALEGRRMAAGHEPVHESLQGLVRHQLELLVTPSLRWEGDVWSGLFMALVIHLPQGGRGGRGEGDAEARRGEREPGWRSDLTLEVAGLGPLKVSLWMRQTRLDLDLEAPDESARARLEARLASLRRRLEGQGFAEVQLRLGVSTGTGDATGGETG